jgi:hypothetical protein
MSSLDSLPADQRAVIQLVLQRGRSYDDIAALLTIDRAAVRQRALDGFDAIGPESSLPAPQRALLTDYLLGQLPPRVADQVHGQLQSSPPARAWARLIASELGEIAAEPLPEIPVGTTRREEPEPAAADPAAGAEYQQYEDEPAAERLKIPPDHGLDPPGTPERPASRRGGAILLGLVALVVVVVVVIIAVTGGNGTKTPASHPAATASTSSTPSTSSTSSTPATTTGTGSTSTPTSTTTPKVLHQINLTSPSATSKAAGIAEVVAEGKILGIVIEAQGLTPNTTHNAYAVWLENSPTEAKFIGFVSQRVGSTGKLATEGQLPTGATQYKQMVITLETTGHPTTPGPIALEGAFSEG